MGPGGFLDAPIPDLLCMTRWLGHNFCDATFGPVPFFFFDKFWTGFLEMVGVVHSTMRIDSPSIVKWTYKNNTTLE
jgi:hypothetical protein